MQMEPMELQHAVFETDGGRIDAMWSDVRLHADDHVPPHIHARYQGHEASFTFDGNLLKGDLPRKQRKLVEAWVLLHAEELEADWELAFNLEHPFRIDPLR